MSSNISMQEYNQNVLRFEPKTKISETKLIFEMNTEHALADCSLKHLL